MFRFFLRWFIVYLLRNEKIFEKLNAKERAEAVPFKYMFYNYVHACQYFREYKFLLPCGQFTDILEASRCHNIRLNFPVIDKKYSLDVNVPEQCPAWDIFRTS